MMGEKNIEYTYISIVYQIIRIVILTLLSGAELQIIWK
jgi:hypothetical protein